MNSSTLADPMRMFAEIARVAAGQAESFGVPRNAILASAGFSESGLQSDAAVLSEDTLHGLLMLIIERTGLNTLALNRSADTAMLGLGVVGSLMSAAKSFADGVEIGVRYAPLLANHMYSLQVEASDGTLLVAVENMSRHAFLERALCEGFLANFQRVLHRCAGGEARFSAISVSYAAPAHAASYLDVFGVQPTFDAERTSFTVTRALAERPSLYHCPKTHAYLSAEADLMLAAKTASSGVAAAVSRVLSASATGHQRSMEEVAEALEMSERSLRRKLSSEGTTFRELCQRALSRSAEALLGDPSVPVKAVSFRLGFDSPRSFNRALQAATGKTPTELRSQLVGARTTQH